MAMKYSADQIVELEFLEAVRRRPGMYIGNNNLHGLHHILLEVLDNAVDEAMAGFADHDLGDHRKRWHGHRRSMMGAASRWNTSPTAA